MTTVQKQTYTELWDACTCPSPWLQVLSLSLLSSISPPLSLSLSCRTHVPGQPDLPTSRKSYVGLYISVCPSVKQFSCHRHYLNSTLTKSKNAKAISHTQKKKKIKVTKCVTFSLLLTVILVSILKLLEIFLKEALQRKRSLFFGNTDNPTAIIRISCPWPKCLLLHALAANLLLHTGWEGELQQPWEHKRAQLVKGL